MRDINECTAEVFRRSEKRIKESKRTRSRILACCVPLVICLTVLSTVFLTKTMPKTSDSIDDTAADLEGEGLSEDAVTPFARSDSLNYGNSDQSMVLDMRDSNAVKIHKKIQAVFADSHETTELILGEADCAKDEVQESETYSSEYRIIFTDNNVQFIYSIKDNKLINESTKDEVTLSPVMKEDILSLLGLVIKTEDTAK